MHALLYYNTVCLILSRDLARIFKPKLKILIKKQQLGTKIEISFQVRGDSFHHLCSKIHNYRLFSHSFFARLFCFCDIENQTTAVSIECRETVYPQILVDFGAVKSLSAFCRLIQLARNRIVEPFSKKYNNPIFCEISGNKEQLKNK